MWASPKGSTVRVWKPYLLGLGWNPTLSREGSSALRAPSAYKATQTPLPRRQLKHGPKRS
eukprot:3229831-Pyramimonas_sp.AAC.1